ncbi:MAG: hypothetical protein ACJ741_13510 [Pyrinomonadaceae bacterium]
MEKRTTRITRSWGATVGYLIGGLVALALSVALFMTIVEGPVTFGIALIPAIVGLMLLYMSLGGAGAGACPGCGAALGGLGTKKNDGVLCGSCHRYAEGQGGALWLTDENRIADDQIFGSPLPDQFNFPAGCCVCGAPETHREKIHYTTQNASSVLTAPTVGVTTSTKISVEVPHCAEHKDGARLSATPTHTLIKFRSYPYLRDFCQLNGTTPA